jgi:hypothetical protein
VASLVPSAGSPIGFEIVTPRLPTLDRRIPGHGLLQKRDSGAVPGRKVSATQGRAMPRVQPVAGTRIVLLVAHVLLPGREARIRTKA